MTGRIACAAIFALLAALLPAVEAHGVPPADQDATRRLLADYNDDCGGDAGTLTGACRGGLDLVALDLREVWDGTRDVAVFRLYADKGQPGSHTVTMTVAAPAGRLVLGMATDDDQHFRRTDGFDSVTDAQPIHDGTRFAVEGRIAASRLGAPGQRITAVQVDATVGGQVGDFMPGGCHNTVGDCQVSNSDGVVYSGLPFALTGPTYFASLEARGGPQTVAAGSERLIQLDVKNLLRDTPQQVELRVDGAVGVQARFHDVDGTDASSYRDVESLGLAGRQAQAIHLSLVGTEAGAKGTLVLTLTTELGGRVQASVPYEVQGGTGTTSPSGSGSGSAGTAKSPAPTGSVAAFLLVAACLARRSR